MTKLSCFSVKVDLSLKDKLRSDLEEQGFEMSQPAYTVFSAKKKGVSCTLYKSGKLTVQGKEMASFIEFYLEPEILQEFQFTNPETKLDLTARIGMDEAGKGDFFGPLCVAALYADSEGIKRLHEMGVRDSKAFSDTAVRKLAKQIRGEFSYTAIRLFPLKYNELYAKFKNLNTLLAWAHVAALSDLHQKTQCKKAILDQFANKSVVERMLAQKKLEIDLVQRVRGEEDTVVAGASILARAAFLDGLEMLEKEHQVILPKGASSLVVKAAAKFAAALGKDALGKIAKTHFKTMNQI